MMTQCFTIVLIIIKNKYVKNRERKKTTIGYGYKTGD